MATIWAVSLREGQAEPDSGVPGQVGGAAAERVVRAPTDGLVTWRLEIGETVKTGVAIGSVADQDVVATIDGVVRGLLTPGFNAQKGLKIADIDPRGDRSACFEISDKARLVGAGVLEAILVWLNRLEK